MSDEYDEMRPITIEQVNDVYLVWKHRDVEILRRKYRIVGCLIGCLPLAVHQNEQLGLPLKLMNEEVYYLIEQGFARVLRRKSKLGRNHEKSVEFFENYRRTQKSEQSVLCYTDKIEEKLSKINEIAQGKIAKEIKRIQNPSNSASYVLRVTEIDLKNVSVSDDEKLEVEQKIRAEPMRILDDDEILTEIFDTSPLDSAEDFEEIHLEFPSESKNRLKYCIFKKLHDQGNFLTSGFKFGVDFLVYPGDPMKYHASHVAVIVDKNEVITNLNKFAYCRLGSQVKKIVLLCTWNADDSDIVFQIVEWEKK